MPKNILFILFAAAARGARTGVVFQPRVEELEPRWAPTGGFGPPTDYGVGRQPVGVAAVDFFPGHPVHLVVANGDSPSFTLLQNQGDGTFLGQTLATTAPLTGLAVAPLAGGGPQEMRGMAAGLQLGGMVKTGCFDDDGNPIPCPFNMTMFPTDPPIIMPLCQCYQTVALGDPGLLLLPDALRNQVQSFRFNSVTGGYVHVGNFATGGSSVGATLRGLLRAPGAINNAITVNFGSSTTQPGSVSVLRGNGDGTYQAPQNLPAGSLPRSLAVGDFNGDGILDLAVANSGDNTVSIRLGNGDGSFQPARTFPAGSFPRSVAVGDFNGDGILDLAVADVSSGTVSVLRGNGDGSFQSPRSFAVGTFPDSVVVGDFNGDGILDLAVANDGSNSVSVLLGNGDGSFQPARSFPVGHRPLSVAVGDVHGDGRLDLAMANYGSNNVSVLLGNGDGSFQPARTFTVGREPSSVAVGDFNGDGISDLVMTNFADNNVGVLLGNGDGSFQPLRTFAVGSDPISVALGDFYGDGISDLAVANLKDNDVSLLRGNGDGTFPEPTIYPVGRMPTAVALGDFNGDGIPDLAVTNSVDNTVSVLLGNGDGTFQPAHTFAVGHNPVNLAAGDFDGDGTLDIVTANQDSNDVSVLLGNGDGTFQAPRTYMAGGSGAAPSGVAVGDFNGDGLPDLAVSLKGADAVAILFNLGGWGPGPGAPRRSGRGARAARGSNPVHDAFIQPFEDRQHSENPIPPDQAQREQGETPWHPPAFDFAQAISQWESVEAPTMSGTRSQRLIHPSFPGPERALAESIVDLVIREWFTLSVAVPGIQSDP
jgi:hypothetical protein